MFTVYKHTNMLTGKSYIGMTSKSMEERWRRHVILANSKQSRIKHTAFAQAIKKYGPSNEVWSHEILFICEKKQDAFDHEKRLISELKTLVPNGYNITLGGEGRFGPMSKNAKQKLLDYCRSAVGRKRNSDSQIQRYMDDPSLRIVRSKITTEIMSRPGMKEKISEAVHKAISSDDTREKIRKVNESNITRKRKSDSAKKSWLSEEIRQKRQNAINKRIQEGKLKNRTVYQIDRSTLLVISVFVSASDASRCTGIHKSSILKCLKNLGKHAGGFYWSYDESQTDIHVDYPSYI